MTLGAQILWLEDGSNSPDSNVVFGEADNPSFNLEFDFVKHLRLMPMNWRFEQPE